ncbi:MAG: hypothetical protein ACLTR8_03515 [Oscillospiraceae bacterium]
MRASRARQAVKGLYGGDGMCQYGCLGYGDSYRACAFDAIHIVDGIAKVDREKCTGCGALRGCLPQPRDQRDSRAQA